MLRVRVRFQCCSENLSQLMRIRARILSRTSPTVHPAGSAVGCKQARSCWKVLVGAGREDQLLGLLRRRFRGFSLFAPARLA